ncbi:MAG TPA: phage tail sheath C-terminal domain-containing protein, partial [Bacillota bacterium]|nr:phage tail sheath C-terminal domain-containing protein [Bacillota bacterium]
KVIVYVLDASATSYDDALEYFETVKFDYLVGAPDITETFAGDIALWVEEEREKGHKVKAVLPAYDADSEAVVNFATTGIKVGSASVTTAAFCSRIAGLIVGTPITQSVTYAAVPEVTSVASLTKTELDSQIDAGEFLLFHDGEKVKVARGVTSLATTSGKIAAMKKIKIVEAMDMMENDIKTTCEDVYIGKFPNSYDNKCILMASIKSYLQSLETEGILQAGKSDVSIDLDAQRQYLASKGVDESNMTEQELKEYNTDDKVFLQATVKILDAIEYITLNIVM